MIEEIEDARKEWIQTDDFQFVKEVSKGIFKIINIAEINEIYAISYHSIDLNNYTKEELENAVNTYYKSLEDLYAEYKESSNQIIAEILSEQETFSKRKLLGSLDEVKKWILENYKITLL
ncbi:hypothetical protein BJV85_002836 [Clostridium acetobutylicum]|uniref:Uncharacterized protein n=1 Tax=Clostridium acetobutylicum (strain ATCC 824 / DSM 792 / JCM 1419 / IAM 19013 / LMG 5710 / NBRC 13948 / NRRL B-527 / VKM B-1787 / 2291 / W) TaxID=272562 RepID=Q97JW0_CLOAB|nr:MULTISPECIES: hypothetical protein [Clostridium]AAK79135.1 Hypothetical protein CA_C1163 [Clostridium acetobutylicum ATCC 824]ADZ20213.1 Conserved hypothetical protein [Clostridium acetobutylicum EA 2018]AEI31671.1 hypothetical protein SMB_G1183 [Clostridium acetobutylicum DSM 1731]AWV81612.1 hypothetical protein DK921_16240 [Clostridium acetobutylicum]MBC2393255.1 hypothetical protein [Clostridium acetobutylicum]